MMEFTFLDDVKRQLLSFYRGKGFPATFFIGCFFIGGYLNQWIIPIIGLFGFLYFQFFKRER